MYIAEMKKIIPQTYPADYIADRMYPVEVYGSRINKTAQRLAKKIGVEYRASVLDFDLYPQIALATEQDHPKNWGVKMVNSLTTKIHKNEIGFFGIGYNLSYHLDILPNLASQIGMASGLDQLDNNEEVPYYGCAVSLYVLEKAKKYCEQSNRPVIIFIFDQCFTGFPQIKEEDKDFRKLLISNLLFTDGGIGMLVIPETMRHRYRKPLIRITNIETKYAPGSLIRMQDGKFIMSSRTKQVMPKMVSDLLIKPFLEKRRMAVSEIREWSIHQGGSEVLVRFCDPDTLNLSREQIERSMQKFYEYGNTSAASCLLVLESFFNDPKLPNSSSVHGIILGFGAGYYLGIASYTWD